ncbi:MAG: hypothetical protein FWB76_08095 [Oscillospiraceae bacterium]|nr:hypothetical protein [Oscillospiraceae bacterium]
MKEVLRRYLSVVLVIAVSVVLLAGVTHAHANRHREALDDRIQRLIMMLEGHAHHADTEIHASIYAHPVHIFLMNNHQSGILLHTRLYQALPLLEVHGEQPQHYNLIATYSNTNLRIPAQEQTIEEVAEMHMNCVCRILAPMRVRASNGITYFWHCFFIGDERFYIVGVAQAFPLRAALRQLAPVYAMAALLFAALIIVKKKHTTITHEENPDA